MGYIQLLEKVKKKIPTDKYRHSVGVAEAAGKLAQRHGVCEEKARISGLIHDYARHFDAETLLQTAFRFGIVGDEIQKKAPGLLHGPVGSKLAESELNISDSDIIRAVCFHTTGHPDMTVLDKIIYIADYIEEGRDYPGVRELKNLSFQDLDRACLMGLENTIKFLINTGRLIHPITVETRNTFIEVLGV